MTNSSRPPSYGRQPQGRRLPLDRLEQARRLCRHAAAFACAFDLERWTSSLLGRFWERRWRIPHSEDDDPMLVVCKPILDAFAAVGGGEGKRALTAVARLDRGRLGVVAGELAAALPAARMPAWLAHVGEARVTRAFSAYSSGDGEAVFLRVDGDGHDGHMVAAFISEQLGGIAKHLLLSRIIDRLGSDSDSDSELQLREIDPILACRRVRIAIDRTDKQAHPPVGEEYSEHRALALARVVPRSGALRLPVAG
jgi:hypothetical protein